MNVGLHRRDQAHSSVIFSDNTHTPHLTISKDLNRSYSPSYQRMHWRYCGHDWARLVQQ
ncbi:hypothetical protein T492DRAFT_921146 [Pavlovales sp. CCMP2436]|nr:hypothetical protein T492DRAFT_921146 [Pavlovales sp. CCMP2436]